MLSGEPLVFSIVIPTYRRLDRLDGCLEAIARLTYPKDRFEVIVVDDGSPDSPCEVVRKYDSMLDVRLLTQSHQGVSTARNLGAREARGQYLAFTADDCRPKARWLCALVANLEQEKNQTAIGGAICNGRNDNIFAEVTQLLMDYLYQATTADPLCRWFFTPNNLAVPAAGFQAVGGFDPAFKHSAGEDRDFCARWAEHGFGLAYCQDAEVVHMHPLNLFSFLHLHWRYGRGTGLYRLRLAHRLRKRLKLERPAYYLELIIHPVRQHGIRALPLTLLLILSQIANVAGFLLEWTKALPQSARATNQT